MSPSITTAVSPCSSARAFNFSHSSESESGTDSRESLTSHVPIPNRTSCRNVECMGLSLSISLDLDVLFSTILSLELLFFYPQHPCWHTSHYSPVWHILYDNCTSTYETIFTDFMYACHNSRRDSTICIFVCSY